MYAIRSYYDLGVRRVRRDEDEFLDLLAGQLDGEDLHFHGEFVVPRREEFERGPDELEPFLVLEHRRRVDFLEVVMASYNFV